MSDTPESPRNVYRLKPSESPPPQLRVADSSQPIDVRDLVRQGASSGPLRPGRAPVKTSVSDKVLFTLSVGAIVGQMLFWEGLRAINTAHEARTWATTPGIIQSVSIAASKSPRRRTFWPVVKYSYVVNGSRYLGSRVDLRDHQAYYPLAVESPSYRVGQRVSVLYDPKNPHSALLEAGTSMENWILLGVGSFLTVAGVFAAVALVRSNL